VIRFFIVIFTSEDVDAVNNRGEEAWTEVSRGVDSVTSVDAERQADHDDEKTDE